MRHPLRTRRAPRGHWATLTVTNAAGEFFEIRNFRGCKDLRRNLGAAARRTGETDLTASDRLVNWAAKWRFGDCWGQPLLPERKQ